MPEYVRRLREHRNGHRTSYVMSVFEAASPTATARPDGRELLELRYVDQAAAAELRLARWAEEVLRAVFDNGPGFRAPRERKSERGCQ